MFLRAVLRYSYRYDDPQNKYEENMNYGYDQVHGWMPLLYRLNYSLQLTARHGRRHGRRHGFRHGSAATGATVAATAVAVWPP